MGDGRGHRFFLLASFIGAATCATTPQLWPWFVLFCGLAAVSAGLSWRFEKLTTADVLLWALVFRLLFLPLLPTLSDDGFRYVWDGMLQINGINPFAFRPSDEALVAFQSLPLYGFLNSTDYYSVYPPFSQIIFGVGGTLTDTGWAIPYMTIKLFFLGAECVGMFLLSRLVTARSLLLYAWNPVVIVEVAGQAHSEAILACALIVIVWALRKERPTLATLALTAAVWTKLYPIVLLPFLIRRTGVKHLATFVGISVLLVGPYYRPDALAHLLESLGLYVHLFEFNSGPYLALKWLAYDQFHGTEGIERILGLALRWAFFLSLVLVFWLDGKRSWTFERVCFVVLGLFLVCSTTIHPWYFLGVLALAPMLRRVPVAWIWLALTALGTYLLYSHNLYWPVVWIGWTGWGILLLTSISTSPSSLVDTLLRKRARSKAQLIMGLVPDLGGRTRYLDVGSAEGYVGEVIARETGARVELCDVRAANRTQLPYTVVEEGRLPFGADTFEVVSLVFVLHHSRDPEALLAEVSRVSRDAVLVIESTYTTPIEMRVLRFLDLLANRVRSFGEMKDQEEHLHHRTAKEWRETFERLGLRVELELRRGRFPHHVTAFLVR